MPERSDSISSMPRFSRRNALKGLAGLAAAGAAAPLLSACSSDNSTGNGNSSGSGPITFGSNYSDDSTKAAFAIVKTCG